MRKIFSAFDTKGRDYITRDNFLQLLRKVAPRLERSQGDRLFSALDTLSIGKVNESENSFKTHNYCYHIFI
jgi:Ca2+-binding EF-hand superfamily protein